MLGLVYAMVFLLNTALEAVGIVLELTFSPTAPQGSSLLGSVGQLGGVVTPGAYVLKMTRGSGRLGGGSSKHQTPNPKREDRPASKPLRGPMHRISTTVFCPIAVFLRRCEIRIPGRRCAKPGANIPDACEPSEQESRTGEWTAPGPPTDRVTGYELRVLSSESGGVPSSELNEGQTTDCPTDVRRSELPTQRGAALVRRSAFREPEFQDREPRKHEAG